MGAVLAAEERKLRNDCIAVLSNVPRDLNFPLAKHRISYENLQAIGRDISIGLPSGLGVRFFNAKNPPVDKWGRTSMPAPLALKPGIIAWYDPTRKMMTLTQILSSTSQKAALVHESVHALIHKQGGSIRNGANEGAAYIAEGWYLWRSIFAPQDKDSRTKLAIRTAQHVYLVQNANNLSKSNEALKAFIKKHPETWKKILADKLKKMYDALIKNLKVDYDDLDAIVVQSPY